MKPLSQKALQKKYEQLGLAPEKIELLHNYFLCFSNLYGVISVREAWPIFKNYEGAISIHKKDFIDFSGIVQREEQPYAVLELKDVYKGETSEAPEERLITNKQLITSGHYRYTYIQETIDHQGDKPWFMPDKEFFFTFNENRLYKTSEGLKFELFISNLKSGGRHKNFENIHDGEITDINNDKVRGKKLSDFKFYTVSEQFDIDYTKSDAEKEKLRKKYNTTAAEKVLTQVSKDLLIGERFPNITPSTMERIIGFIDCELGVSFTESQLEKFVHHCLELHTCFLRQAHFPIAVQP